MESTGPYSEASATNLVAEGWRVSVVNAARIKGFTQGELARNKTDRADAMLLARFCAAMRPFSDTSSRYVASVTRRELRGGVDRLQALKEMHQQESNRMEAHPASGQTVKSRTMMSRTGHNELRRALYMPSLVARHHNPVLKTFGDRLSVPQAWLPRQL